MVFDTMESTSFYLHETSIDGKLTFKQC